ncbi:enoyl-CoA hydratase/isomerase family protein [Streptomyces sp. NPDC056697]|uniref:enoyl-CoA hydratase/isomerase family protein n=1 Tax=Streptomyces sp. NPDC056697 TaxID=3345915 RepID=UPI00368AF8E5
MGIVPGGGGTQYLRDRVGRNRALEVVLTADLFDAETAASYGWINRALPAGQLDEYVDRIARNIAPLPDGVIEAAKRTACRTHHGRTPPRERGVGHSDCFACRSAVDGPRAARRRADTGGRTRPRGTDAQCRAPNEPDPIAEARTAVRVLESVADVRFPTCCRWRCAAYWAVEPDRFDKTFRAVGEGLSHPRP